MQVLPISLLSSSIVLEPISPKNVMTSSLAQAKNQLESFKTRNQKHRHMPDNAYRQEIVPVYGEGYKLPWQMSAVSECF